LAVLASWNSVTFPVSQGRAINAERYCPQLATQLDAAKDTIAKQLLLLDWFFGQFHDNLPAHAIVRYEELVASRGQVLRVISSRASELSAPLASRNGSPLYERLDVTGLADRLQRSDGRYWRYYSQNDVEALAQQFAARRAA
jgi:hypothetical protein